MFCAWFWYTPCAHHDGCKLHLYFEDPMSMSFLTATASSAKASLAVPKVAQCARLVLIHLNSPSRTSDCKSCRRSRGAIALYNSTPRYSCLRFSQPTSIYAQGKRYLNMTSTSNGNTLNTTKVAVLSGAVQMDPSTQCSVNTSDQLE